MDWLKNVFSPSSVIASVDMMVLTEEERLIHQKDMLKLYEPFKILQRYLTFAVTLMFGLVLIVTSAMFIGSIWFPILEGKAEIYTDLEVVQMVGYSFMAVISLYMSGGTINSYFSGINSKK